MSFSQADSLPSGYSLRLAAEQDVAKILRFDFFDRDSSAKNRLFYLFSGFAIVILMGFIFNINIILNTIGIFLKTSILIGVLFFIVCHQKYLSGMRKNLICFWIVECKDKVRGYIGIYTSEEYNFIFKLLISTKHRNMGIGSALVSHGMSSEKPTYLVCQSYLKSFYIRRGFVDSNYLDVPHKLNGWRTYKNFSLMVSNVD